MFKAGDKKNQASPTRKKKSWLPFVGVVLVLAGVVFFAATSGMAAAQWLLGMWPLFAILAGVAGVMGFAVERKPKSPVGAMLLLFIGVLFTAGRFQSNLNALQIYGRYWILLLFVFAGVEIIRHYSHRLNDGKPPRLFSFGKLLMITLIVGSGVLANRVAVNNPSLLASLKLPAFLSSVRDSVIGETYNFTDEVILPTLKPNAILTVNNSHGNVNVKVVGGLTIPRAVLVKNIRAWKQEDANEISDKIKLQLVQAVDGSVNISTNRDEVTNEVNHEFNTHIQIEVPATYGVSITNSYGDIIANDIQGDVALKSSFGRAEAINVKGNAVFNLKNSEAAASSISGNVTVTGAKKVKLNNVEGAVTVEANNGSVDLRNVIGMVKIDATYSRITLLDLQQSAAIKTSHGSVKISNTGSVAINAPYSEVTAANIRGDLRVESSNKDIRATSISGDLIVETEHAEVRADDVQGDVKIKTSHGEVSVKNFHQGVEVETSYRDVVLTVADQVAGDINVENNRGEIKIVLPQTSNFTIDAESQGGKVKPKGFANFSQPEKDSLIASNGSIGPTIKLRTSLKDIIVQASGSRQAQSKGAVKAPATLSED